MKKIATFLLSSILLVSAAACANTAKTTASAPDTAGETVQSPDVDTAQTNEGDGTSEVRERQIESDIRAREGRNDLTGDDTERADGDLNSEVRGKLEANLPASQLAVDAKDGVVTISGTVPTQEQLDRIEPLAKEIKGVKEVNVQATVAPTQPQS
ncbi:BON domain-containing protein [Phormidium tenue FACHB-886]|nr:BON domain-containing protein [Phormidium tenue FACHB-886]